MNFVNYTVMNKNTSRPKDKIGRLLKEVGEILTVSSAAKVLDLPHIETSKVLSRWVTQGWLVRPKRGIYLIKPIDSLDEKFAFEEPWLLASKLYSPCYIGGWTATEHWDLTEQIFNDICVLTEQIVIYKKQNINQQTFLLNHIAKKINFGTKVIWKKNQKILVSDPHKTIIDMLYIPSLGGGIQHAIDCFKEYLNSTHYSVQHLLDYALMINTGSVFKRLGYLYVAVTGKEDDLVEVCRKNLTRGIIDLDPAIKEGKILTSWGLRVPEQIKI